MISIVGGSSGGGLNALLREFIGPPSSGVRIREIAGSRLLSHVWIVQIDGALGMVQPIYPKTMVKRAVIQLRASHHCWNYKHQMR